MMRSLDHNSYHLYQITTRFIQTMTDIQTSKVCLVSATPDAEKHMAYCARVSNPKNQNNESIAGLLKYCIKHQHWSIFEQAFMTLEINTSRAIAAQILRHRSFTFQEFSQRYADSSLLGSSIPVQSLPSSPSRPPPSPRPTLTLTPTPWLPPPHSCLPIHLLHGS